MTTIGTMYISKILEVDINVGDVHLAFLEQMTTKGTIQRQNIGSQNIKTSSWLTSETLFAQLPSQCLLVLLSVRSKSAMQTYTILKKNCQYDRLILV